MKSMIFLLSFSLVVFTGYTQENLVPGNYKSNKEVIGDLDKDGIPEKVVVYDIITAQNENNGINRELIIYKKQSLNWKIWKRSKYAVKNSEQGGMMGDPFDGVEIVKGILLINHSGGSSYKWTQTDKYRFQNNQFELIGFKEFSGRPCDNWFDFDYNISSGRIEVTNEFEKCEEKEPVVYKRKNEVFIHKLNALLTLENRYKEDDKSRIMIVSPKYKHELYLRF